MTPDPNAFLAAEIISEQNTISYRNLSRALKVHCNAAKCMLFDFYQKENAKKPGSIYATYLLAGTKKIWHIHGHETSKGANGDVPMPSSPPAPPSSMPQASQATEHLEEVSQVPVKTILLCREEDLENVKAQFEKITSLHVYSLSSTRLPDLQTLIDTGRSVFADHHSKQDPLIHNKDYGIIQNPHVRRRKGKRPINVDVPQPSIYPTNEEKQKQAIKNDLRKEEPTASRPSSPDSTTTQESVSKTKPKPKPTTKKDATSLFKAFAKQNAKPKLERNDTGNSAASSNGDTKMSGMDDDDEEGVSEDEAMFLDTGTVKSKKRAGDVQKEKEERRAKLRKMMEDDEDDVPSQVPKVEDATEDKDEQPAAKADEDLDAPDGDADEDVAWSDSDAEHKNKKQQPGSQHADAGPKRRRRGRRKVMKKRTMKDEEGFLVTREEEAWESFSEDEPEPVRKLAPATTTAATTKSQHAPPKSANQKSTASKSGGGGTAGKKKDIMSFFGKK